MDTNPNLTAAKASVFFQKENHYITTEAASTKTNFKGRTNSDFQPHKHLRGFLPSTTAEVNMLLFIFWSTNY